MITPEKISELVQSKVDEFKKIKAYVDGIPSKKKDRLDPPEFNQCYGKTVELFQEIRPHAEKGFYPAALFREKAPNQLPVEYEYSKNVFKILGTPTYSYWAKALSKINRIWNEKNYFIKYPEIEGSEYANYQPKEYFEKEYPNYRSIEAYFREMVTAMKLEDPNAWACLDVDVPMVDEETPDQSEPVEPYITLIACYKIMAFEEDEWLLTLTDERTWVDYGGGKKKEGLVLEFRDHIGLYRIPQVGKQIEWTFGEPELIYEWNLDYLPCQRLKGQPKYKGDHLYYQSYFAPAVSNLNTALVDANTLQVSKIVAAFPERWEYTDDCDACQGHGWIENYSGSERLRTQCTACAGGGKKNLSNKLSVLEVPVPKSANPLSPDTANMQPPFAGYVTKDEVTQMLEFLDKQVKDNCISAFAFLNIDVSNSDVNGASDTALGKKIDREELFSLLLLLANEDFGLMEFCINAIGEVRYGSAWQAAEIGYPQNFTIRSDEDITTELNQAKTAGIPTIAQQALIKEWANLRFNSRTDINNLFELIVKVDRLYTYTPLEIIQKLAVQVVATWEVILHDSIDQMIELAVVEKEGFMELDIAEQRAYLVEKAKALALEIAPKRVNTEYIISG